jgi:hypothetical protein
VDERRAGVETKRRAGLWTGEKDGWAWTGGRGGQAWAGGRLPEGLPEGFVPGQQAPRGTAGADPISHRHGRLVCGRASADPSLRGYRRLQYGAGSADSTFGHRQLLCGTGSADHSVAVGLSVSSGTELPGAQSQQDAGLSRLIGTPAG